MPGRWRRSAAGGMQPEEFSCRVAAGPRGICADKAVAAPGPGDEGFATPVPRRCRESVPAVVERTRALFARRPVGLPCRCRTVSLPRACQGDGHRAVQDYPCSRGAPAAGSAGGVSWAARGSNGKAWTRALPMPGCGTPSTSPGTASGTGRNPGPADPENREVAQATHAHTRRAQKEASVHLAWPRTLNASGFS